MTLIGGSQRLTAAAPGAAIEKAVFLRLPLISLPEPPACGQGIRHLDSAHPPFIVLDACVLMSGIVRRLVLRLAEAGVYQPVWTERIGEEWRRNASRIWEIPPEVMAEQWADMNARFPQALEHDAQACEASLRYSDPKDFHVIAAGLARRARCGCSKCPWCR